MKEEFDGRDKGVCLWRTRPLQAGRRCRGGSAAAEEVKLVIPARTGQRGLRAASQRAFLQGVARKFGKHLTLMEIFSNVQNWQYWHCCLLCIPIYNIYISFFKLDVSGC